MMEYIAVAAAGFALGWIACEARTYYKRSGRW